MGSVVRVSLSIAAATLLTIGAFGLAEAVLGRKRMAAGEAIALVVSVDDGADGDARWDAVTALDDVIHGFRVRHLRVPGRYDAGVDALLEAIGRTPASAVVVLSTGGREIEVVRSIANTYGASAPADEAGRRPSRTKIHPYGPDLVRLDRFFESILVSLRQAGLPEGTVEVIDGDPAADCAFAMADPPAFAPASCGEATRLHGPHDVAMVRLPKLGSRLRDGRLVDREWLRRAVRAAVDGAIPDFGGALE